MQKRSTLSVPLLIAVGILLALTVCGSLWDLTIAHAVYVGESPAENPFGIMFAFVGIIPTFVGWSFLGASILYLTKKQVADTQKRRWLSAFAILLFLLSFFYFCNTLYFSNANVIRVPVVVAYSVGLAVIGTAAYLGYKLSAKSGDGALLQKALFLAAVSLVTLLIISCTKEIMCRPRFRFVLSEGNPDYFKSWWQSGRAIKNSLGLGMESDEFASFPSGHSAYSMFAIFLFPALGDYVRRLKPYKPLLFALGFLWWAVTALSRLTMGAHYLTDVTLAGLVTIFAYAVVSALRRSHAKRRGRSDL